MSATDILAEIPRLSAEELAALRRALGAGDRSGSVREVPGSGAREAGYEKLFGCLPGFEIPERHRWRPAPRFD